MEAFRNEEIAGLLGDFYQAHANENREVMEQSLMKMQNLLYTGEALSLIHIFSLIVEYA